MKKLILCFSVVLSILIADTSNTQAQQKKMSGQARGAIIGGAGGAIAGGLIGHGVKGALIGGAIGAGGGYIIGNEHRRHVAKKKRAHFLATHRRVHKAVWVRR